MKVKHDPPALARSSREIVLSAVFFALTTGLCEALVKAFRGQLLHRLVWVSRDSIWMTPLAYLLFFLVPALCLAAGSRLLKRAVPLRWTVTFFAFLTVFAWLLPFTQLARWTSAILALGVGVQAARMTTRDSDRWLSFCARAATVMGLFVVVAGLGSRAWRSLAERRALSSLPAAETGRPNILFIVLDTVRRANLGLFGYPHPTTPNLDRWAQGGMVFDRAMATAPWTLTSHGSMFTGLPAAETGGDWTVPVSRRPRLLAEALRDHGYVTGGFVANLLYTSYESGLARGFAHYDDYQPSLRMMLVHSSFARTRLATSIFDAVSAREVARAVLDFKLFPARVPADVFRPARSVTDAFLAWQPGAGPRPFFAFLNYFDAHWQGAQEPFHSQMERDGSRMPIYDGAIASMDHEVGRLLDSLRQRGVLDHTLVIVVSDHGEQFGEHHLNGHANSLYLPLLAVPLIVRYPASVPPRQRIDALVTLRDLPATVLELAGVPDSLPGRSLSRYWRTMTDAEPSDVIAELSKGDKVDSTFPNARGPMVARLDDRMHYIRNGRGEDELYAYRSDTLELDNLAARSEYRADLERLRDGLVHTGYPPARAVATRR